MWHKDKKSKSGILLILGAIIGAITALFLSTDEKGETKETVKKKVSLLKNRLKDAKEEEVIKKIFGSKSKQVTKTYQKAKKQLATKLAKIKGSIAKIDKQKYTNVVNEIVAELKKNKEATSPQLKKLRSYLNKYAPP